VRSLRFLLISLALYACEPATGQEELVEFTLRLKLAGGRDVGATPGRVWVFTDSAAVPRVFAFPAFGEPCVLATTPETVCTFQVPRFGFVSLIASEPDPAVVVRLAPQSAQDTVRDGRYVEFTGWTECPDRAERGVCIVRPRGPTVIEGNFQLLQQIIVYQVGAARMDYIASSAGPTLKVPAENYNILDYAGCRRVLDYGPPCDSVRLVGETPYHRVTAFVPRQTIFGMFPVAGLQTEFQRWDGDCIPASIYALGVCSLISPDTSGAAIVLTARYSWWQCGNAISDLPSPGCVLRGVEASSLKKVP
jgi:hypothetical protein